MVLSFLQYFSFVFCPALQRAVSRVARDTPSS